MRHDCGIYVIEVARGELPAKFYIGQSVTLALRRDNHFWALRKGRHKNPLLQSAFNKHGEAAVKFSVLLYCEGNAAVLTEYEQLCLDFYIREFGEERVYNCLRDCVKSRLGIKVSEETRARMRASGRGFTPEEQEKARIANTGRKLSPEAIAHRTLKQTGLKRSEETKRKLSAALTGIKRSPETCAKISASKKGKSPSLEHMEKLRVASTGRKKTPEEIEKSAASRRGQKRPGVGEKAWETRRRNIAEKARLAGVE